ncbi:MAG: TIR domain-containing protein [Pirellulaceae bacterium]
MVDTDTPSPKVFISYSWSSDDHIEWVADLGERLMNDGIEVVLDQWSLEDGHDVNAFMEKMVSDPSIKRVIVVSDSLYAAKADGRKGGVGTETQIISKEVYESVYQGKFIPVVRERNDEGEACLPVYLKARKYIDFSSADTEADAYEQLIRNIYERPKRPKPALGKAPSHLFDDSPVTVTSAQKGKRFRDLVASGKGRPSVPFEDFCDDFIANLEDLRMTFSKEEQDKWCDSIRENIAAAHAHRDVFVDVIRTGAMHMASDEFVPLLLGLLERMLPFTNRPRSTGVFYKASEDNYKFLCYEMFLYTVSALIRAKKFNEVRQLINHRYVAPDVDRGGMLEGHSYRDFNAYATSLEDFCATQGNRKRLSVMADLLHDRADRTDIRYSDLFQADVILSLNARGFGWYPRSMIYSQGVGKLELFLRAVTEEGFRPLGILLGVTTPQEMLAIVQSESMQGVWQSEKMWHADFTLEALNYRELTDVWGKS